MVNIREMFLLKCDLNFGLPVLAVITIIHSLWASSYFFLSLSMVFRIRDEFRDDYLIGPLKNTYYLLCISTTVILYYGFKNVDKKLIRYWHLLKLAECGLIITSIIILLSSCRSCFWPYVLVAIPILCSGWYIHTSIKKGYHELGVELDPISISNIFKNVNHSNQDSPPHYEAVEKTQEDLNPLAANALRTWGFTKLLEFVIICPGIILLVTSTQTITGLSYNYWNMFWIIAGLGLCFAICVRFVWRMIPKKSYMNTEQNTEEQKS